MKVNIGIVGQGFVGSAVREGLKNFYDIKTFDLDPEKRNCEKLSDLVEESDIIFQCLPTPMKRSGECDISIVKNSLSAINQIAASKKIVIIKSTVPPGTTQKLDQENENLEVLFSPEFLTEANSFDDFKNQTRIILGGPRKATTKVKTMFRKAFPQIPIIKTSSEIAEMIKYFTNCFLATKVIFANEMYQICQASGIDYDKVCEYVLHDQRIGKSHLAVPGPDGDLGFGGHCFPKDLEALIYLSESVNVKPHLLSRVLENNDKIRKNRDWESMKGRAVVDD